MTIGKATRKYEAWLGKHARLVEADIAYKHQAMAENAFSFFRATFYRWAQHWPDMCPRLAEGPRVLAVGDFMLKTSGPGAMPRVVLHGASMILTKHFRHLMQTIWCAWPALAMLAIRGGHLAFSEEAACEAILAGYRESLEVHGRPIIIEETHRWFAPLIEQRIRDRAHFWQKLGDIPPLESTPPKAAMKVLRGSLPEKCLEIQVGHRVAGLGSLGKPRYVALAEWHGGPIAREAKSLTPSAFAWAAREREPRHYYAKLLDAAIRCPDPMFRVRGNWIVRRLSPECGRVELVGLPKPHDDTRLLHAMGWETANVHWTGGQRSRAVAADARRRGAWLYKAAGDMLEATLEDWHQWKAELPTHEAVH